MRREESTEILAEISGSEISADQASLNKYIPASVYQNLPEPLQELTTNFSEREKDIVLLSALGVLSACLPNVFGVYDSRKYHPNLNIFIIAPPASGKGVMSWSGKLIEPIHQLIIRESKRRIAEYERVQESSGIPKPKFQIKVVPGNTSSSKFFNHLESAEDSLLIFESEADSLSKMLKQDWGDFSDLLRKSFHHERASISRQSEDKFYEIVNPRLSIVLSGTPDQVKPLIESKENGLFSRFIYYYFDDIAGWKDVSPRAQRVNHDGLFESKAEEVLSLYNTLKGLDAVEVKMNDQQWDIFQSKLILANNIITDTNKSDFIPVVRRLGVICFRIIMTLTILRNKNLINTRNQVIYASNEDVNTGIELLKVFTEHSLVVFDKYEKKKIKMTMNERVLYTNLPINFRRQQGLEIAQRLGYAERTFDDTLRRWERNKVLNKVSHGSYQKNGLS